MGLHLVFKEFCRDAEPSSPISELRQSFEPTCGKGVGAAFNSDAAVLAAGGCISLASFNTHPPESVGVITVGGPHHATVCWDTAERALATGAGSVHPLQFPQTVSSSVPTFVARVCAARAFALCVGNDHQAFFDVLDLAAQMIRQKRCDATFLAGLFAVDDFINSAMHKSSLGVGARSVICGFAQRESFDGASISILQSAIIGSESDLKYTLDQFGISAQQTFIADRTGARTVTNYPSVLTGRDFVTATGAVLLHEAAAQADSEGPFAVALKHDSRIRCLVAHTSNRNSNK